MADLGAGTKSVTNVALRRGWEVESIDKLWGQRIEDWEPKGHYNLIWASPPCEKFSIAGRFKHFEQFQTKDGIITLPRTKQGEEALDLTRQFINKARYSNADFHVIENPRGLMHKIWLNVEWHLTWWCQWGDERAKPTMLGGKLPEKMLPLPICKNSSPNCSHARARRGSPTGTQGRKGMARSMIPEAFSEALLTAIEEATR